MSIPFGLIFLFALYATSATLTNQQFDKILNEAVEKADRISNQILEEYRNSTATPYYASNCICVPSKKCKNITSEYLTYQAKLNNSCASPQICCKQEDIIEALESNDNCGTMNGIDPNLKPDKTQFGEFPWMAVVFRKNLTNNTAQLFDYTCGGSLIHPRVVLTAAHCVNKQDQFSVRVGKWGQNKINKPYSPQNRIVDSIKIHRNYKDTDVDDDIALLFLKSSVYMGIDVKLVYLPLNHTAYNFSNCWVSRYEVQNNIPISLKKIDLPIVPHKECQKAIRQNICPHFILSPKFVCAGGKKGKDTCQGDGGSPLVCSRKDQPNRYEQVGIVAWGFDCGRENVPGFYVNVARYRHWIVRQMNAKGFNLNA